MSEPRYACRRCGTWTCSACGGQRANTDVRYVYYPCSRCRGLAGVLVPTMHTIKMWNKHNDDLLPTPYAYGEQPPAEEWGPGFGGRDVPHQRYRGVPVPVDARLNLESFQRGVDAALDMTNRVDDKGRTKHIKDTSPGHITGRVRMTGEAVQRGMWGLNPADGDAENDTPDRT